MKPPSAILNMNRGFSVFSSRRPLDRGSSRGGPGRSSRSPFRSSAGAEGAELTPEQGLLPAPDTPPCARRALEQDPVPGTPACGPPQTPPPDSPRDAGGQVPPPITSLAQIPCFPLRPLPVFLSIQWLLLPPLSWRWLCGCGRGKGTGREDVTLIPGPRKRELPRSKPLLSPKPRNPPGFSLSPRYPGSGSISPGIPGTSSSNGIFLGSSRSPSDGAGLGASA